MIRSAPPASPPVLSSLSRRHAAGAPGARGLLFTLLGEFVLPYEAVRTSPDPDAALLAFLESTYEAAANCGKWDRAALEAAQA